MPQQAEQPRPFNVGRFGCRARDYKDLTTLPLVERLAFLNACPPGTPVRVYGYEFEWTPGQHAHPEDLERMRAHGDPLADAAWEALAEARRNHPGLRPGGEGGGCPVSAGFVSNIQIIEALVGGASGSEGAGPATAAAALPAASLTALGAFLHAARAVPAWVDWAAVARGQTFFRRNAGLVAICLLNLSLIGGFGSPRINSVLEATGYLTGSRDATLRRLFETFQMVMDACVDEDSLRPGGAGWASVLNVRLLHAAVRRRLLARPGGWDVTAYGLPINQEDMLVTQLAFSVSVLMGGERLGLLWHVSESTMTDFLHLWAVIGHLMGVDGRVCAAAGLGGCMASPAAAAAALESICAHILEPNPSSSRIATHVIDAVALRRPLLRSHDHMVRVTRALVGDAYASALGVPAPGDPAMLALSAARAGEMGLGGGSVGASPRSDEASVAAALDGTPSVALRRLWQRAMCCDGRLQRRFKQQEEQERDAAHKKTDGDDDKGAAVALSSPPLGRWDGTATCAGLIRHLYVLTFLLCIPGLRDWLAAATVAGLRRFVAGHLKGGRTVFDPPATLPSLLAPPGQ